MLVRMLAATIFISLAIGRASAQTLTAVQTNWNATFTALRSGDEAAAKAAFGRFNLALRSYSNTNPIDWRTEYLAGSLDCQFAETRSLGAHVLNDILQNNRSLNEQGNAEITRVMNACQTPAVSRDALTSAPPVPANLLDASAHFIQPGVRGNTKSGDSFTPPKEFHSAVATVSSAELEARRVSIGSPQAALDRALASIGEPSAGTTQGGFAVADLHGTSQDAAGVADCLASYAEPMKAEFQIEPSRYMLTVFVVPDRVDVYELARRLHGLVLPPGVLAYSVPEDMSLTAQGGTFDCGSLAHEMFHLLIKDRFPGAPAWLEEGIASEVAVAKPLSDRFLFGWSWRDKVLWPDPHGRPTINDLLDMSWADFSEDPDYPASYIQATAAVFIRYLDQQNKLQPIYFAVRDHHLSSGLSTYRSYREILEDVFHAPISIIQANFDTWFAEQYRVNSHFSVSQPVPKNSAPSLPVCKTPEDFTELRDHESHPMMQSSAPCVRPMPAANANPMSSVPSPSSDH